MLPSARDEDLLNGACLTSSVAEIGRTPAGTERAAFTTPMQPLVAKVVAGCDAVGRLTVVARTNTQCRPSPAAVTPSDVPPGTRRPHLSVPLCTTCL
ncbi:unnamed protein product [Soboliphyme baturini]|uniref:Runt domain-containing protein n=1 Tax=Soboliphyme baturini TaxID=241478 RepID=A0A183IE78_9BILA|nr:unnamed protein product [Soboliphyme baturini]